MTYSYSGSCKGFHVMPRMPEIVGEQQDAGPAMVENEPAEVERGRVVFHYVERECHRQPGIYVSPLRLRLTDFSGEGERAPPGWL